MKLNNEQKVILDYLYSHLNQEKEYLKEFHKRHKIL